MAQTREHPYIWVTWLTKLLVRLRERIQLHSDVLRQSEMLTRYVLVDPLLRELGWDTEDPEQVRPEYRSGPGSADYALFSNGKHQVMVEEKKLDTPLQDGLSQGINYSVQHGTPYFVVTDGRRWEIYETHKTVPIDDKRIVAFDLVAHNPAEVVLSSLSLWRPNIETGNVNKPLHPLVEQSPTMQATAAIQNTQRKSSDVAQPEWVSVSLLHPQLYDKPPKILRFTDGTQTNLKNWADLNVQLVRWLGDKGILTIQQCPIQHASRYVVAATPIHPCGKAVAQDREIGSFYIELNYSGRDQCRNARLILQHVGQSPDNFSTHF